MIATTLQRCDRPVSYGHHRLVSERMQWPSPSHRCGEVGRQQVGSRVTVCGWVDRFRCGTTQPRAPRWPAYCKDNGIGVLSCRQSAARATGACEMPASLESPRCAQWILITLHSVPHGWNSPNVRSFITPALQPKSMPFMHRNHGGVLFLDVRDSTGVLQAVSAPEGGTRMRLRSGRGWSSWSACRGSCG